MNQREPFQTRSPYVKVDQRRRQRLMIDISNTILIFIIPLTLLIGFMLVNHFSVQTLLELFLGLAIAPISLFARWLAKRDRVLVSGYVLLVPIMLIIGINGMIISGLSSIIVVGYILSVIIAGMVIGPRQGYVVAFLGTVFLVISEIIIADEVLPTITLPSSVEQITLFVIYVLSFFFVAIFSKYSTQDLRKALDEATYDLLQANHKLALASEMKSQFTARTSHELRTPLSSIIVFTELAMRGTYGEISSKLKGKLGNVLGSARHLHSIINDLLDLAKIEAGELEICEESFSIYDLGRNVQSTMDETAHQKELTFNVEMADDLPMRMVGDQGRLKQIMLNLVSNAIKFTDHGQVDLKIDRYATNQWRIIVRDTGPGIPEDRFETIFEEYRQLETASKDTARKGTGLGLAITRNLVDMMGGKISIESELGEGTSFEIVLPLKTPEVVPIAG